MHIYILLFIIVVPTLKCWVPHCGGFHRTSPALSTSSKSSSSSSSSSSNDQKTYEKNDQKTRLKTMAVNMSTSELRNWVNWGWLRLIETKRPQLAISLKLHRTERFHFFKSSWAGDSDPTAVVWDSSSDKLPWHPRWQKDVFCTSYGIWNAANCWHTYRS